MFRADAFVRATRLAMARPRAITFDVGGTLIEPWPSVGHVYAQVAAEHGFELSPATINQRFHAAWRGRNDFKHRREDWARLVEQTFGTLVPFGATKTFFDTLYDRFAEAKSWRVFDDVWPALHSLTQRHVKLGIISNWDERLRPLLRNLALDQPLAVIVSSHEAGHMKPAPEIFSAAANQLGLAPAEMLHVGDTIAEDVEGAKAAGMQAFWLDRPRNSLADLL